MNYWLVYPNWGIKKISLSLIFWLCWWGWGVYFDNPMVMAIGLLGELLTGLFWLVCWVRNGYYHRLIRFVEYYQEMEILDKRSWGQSKKNIRIMRLVGKGADFSRIYTDKDNQKSSPYLGGIEILLGQLDGVKKLGKIIVLGGGGMALPIMIVNRFPKAKVIVIEKSIIIKQMAEKYFLPLGVRGVKKIQVEVTGADDWIKTDRAKYQVIIQDLFYDQNYLSEYLGSKWLKQLWNKLSLNGVLIINMGIMSDQALIFKLTGYYNSCSQISPVIWLKDKSNAIFILGSRNNLKMLLDNTIIREKCVMQPFKRI